jgi:hypothetical protein
MIEALSSPETSVLTRVTWRNTPEDTVLHSHRRENLKSSTSLALGTRWSSLVSLTSGANAPGIHGVGGWLGSHSRAERWRGDEMLQSGIEALKDSPQLRSLRMRR